MKGRKTVALLGPYGLGNLGDAATQDAAIDAIRRNWPTARIVGISLDPDDTQARHGIPALPIRAGHPRVEGVKGRLLGMVREAAFLLGSLRAMLDVDVLVISGGGQLDDVWGGAGAHPFALFKWTLLARLAGAKVYFMSVGAGPIYSKKSEWLLKRALRRASYRSFRDEDSRALVQNQLGIPDPGVVVPDLAHTRFDPCDARFDHGEEVETLAIAPLPHVDPRMAPYPGPDPKRYNAYVEKLAEFVDRILTKRSCKVLFYVGEIHQDVPVIEDVLNLLEKRGWDRGSPRLSRPRICEVDELGEALKEAQLFVASRFHSVLLPLAMCRPVVALSYHPKVTNLMRDMGQAEFCLDIDAFTVEELESRVEKLWSSRAAVRAVLEQKSAHYRASLGEQYDRLFPPERRSISSVS